MPPVYFFLPSSNSKKSYELRNTSKVQKNQVFSMILYSDLEGSLVGNVSHSIFIDFHWFQWFFMIFTLTWQYDLWQIRFTRSSEQVAECETWAQLPPKHARECLRASEYSQQLPRAIPHRLEKFLITLRQNLYIYGPQAWGTPIAQLKEEVSGCIHKIVKY